MSSIMYCLSTDNLVDLYVLTVLKLPVKTHCNIWMKLILLIHQVRVVVIKKQLLDLTIIKHCDIKTCFLYIAQHHINYFFLFKPQFPLQALFFPTVSPGKRVG